MQGLDVFNKCFQNSLIKESPADFTDFEKATSLQLRNCIKRYSMQSGFMGFINYVINRIVDAVKSIFSGNSTWEVASKAWTDTILANRKINTPQGSARIQEVVNAALEIMVEIQGLEPALRKSRTTKSSFLTVEENWKYKSLKKELEYLMEEQFPVA